MVRNGLERAKTMTIYNKTKEYNEQIKPLLEKLDMACERLSVPYFATFATENSDTETKYQNSSRTPAPLKLELADNKIIDHIKVLNGFEVVSAESIPVIDFSESVNDYLRDVNRESEESAPDSAE